jgi:histone arginine demethylase JMJD6
MRPISIDVEDGLDYSRFVREYLTLHKAVCVKNAFPQWKALGKWTPDFFRRKYGTRVVTVAGQRVPLGAYLDRVEASTPEQPVPYLRELGVRNFAPELGDDLMPFVSYALPNWLRGTYPDREMDGHMNRAAEVELFIGGTGTKLERRVGENDTSHTGLNGALVSGFADLHYDPTACPVLLCQLYGRKRWWVFSPAQTPYLYAKGRHSMIPDLDAPDPERFPLYERAEGYTFVQEPGDAVYVPPKWWHTTRMLSVSIAVGSTFANAAHWKGVIEDVTSETEAPKRDALRAFLKMDGIMKALRGPRFGEDGHFKDNSVRLSLRRVKQAARSLLGRV